MPKGVYKRLSLEARFWKKVAKGSGDSCWNWTGSLVRRYGAFQVNGCLRKAHRISWEIHFGKVPDGLWVLHKCDNPICVRPDHLFVGTNQDNVDDRQAKGRNNPPKGEDHTHAKLTEKDVLEIRRLYANGGISYAKLAKRFGICPMQACDIVHRKGWKHI